MAKKKLSGTGQSEMGFAELGDTYAAQLQTLAELLAADGMAMRSAKNPKEFTDALEIVAEKLTESAQKWSRLWDGMRQIGVKRKMN